MSKTHNISTYKPKFTEAFLLDNNVWMFLFCPIGNYSKDKKQREYSAFFKELVSNKNTIIINSLILSEFANSYLKLEFNLWKKLPENNGRLEYKSDFVGSPKFLEAVEDVKISIKSILKVAEKFSDDFNAIDIEDVFSNFGKSDFNDSYYIALAQFKKYKIVTDDFDFYDNNTLDIEIITANPKFSQ